jgi:hypothetical protein
MSKDERQWVLRLVKVLGAVGALFFLGLVVNSWLDPFDDRPFDPAAWAAAEERERDRGPMARDAIRHIPNGTPKERVRELFGESDYAHSGYPPDKWGRAVKGYARWTYGLGCWSGLGPYGFDSASLDVHFDPDGRVVEAEITGG